VDTIERLESEVRGYVRSFPTIFDTAYGYYMYDESGTQYLDFFSGAGVLNYGHNNPKLKRAMIEYLERDGIVHSLDMATSAKCRFLERYDEVILKPRGLDYKVQFPGPTGTNTVEAALKLARKVKGRDSIIAFTNAFHGMTLGALSVTGNAFKRAGAGVPLSHATSMPFDGYFGDDTDTIEYLRRYLEDASSGVDLPAGIIVETIQAEGGINVAGYEWLQRLEALAREFDILFIIDDIQVGNGRTGPYFSFEPMGLKPDIVCMSKALSGFGNPFSITLLRRDLDVWDPGEHNGTFRGFNPAFVTATAALDFWEDNELANHVVAMGEIVQATLQQIADDHPAARASVRGRGLIQGLDFPTEGLAGRVCQEAFQRKLILETSGPNSNVVKVMPPLVIDEAALRNGLERLQAAAEAAIAATPLDEAV